MSAPSTNSVSYGWSDADYTATDVLERRGRTLFTVLKGKRNWAAWSWAYPDATMS